MNAQATVKYIVNGYTVSGWPRSEPDVMLAPQSHYAATIEEAMFWVGQILEPPAVVSEGRAATREQPELRLASEDPLSNQEAQITPLTTGGYLVRQQANMAIPSRLAAHEAQAYNLDEVHDILVQVYTAPPPVARRVPFSLEIEEH